jgi:CDP-glucose 4,6-dehydratase
MMFNERFKNKKVLITGHTGFKGSWLTLWLSFEGADLYGISKDIPTKPSMFEALNLKDIITSYFVDLANTKETQQIISKIKPDFIFHLAAQPIVRESFINPAETWMSNTFGTISVLESLKDLENNCVCIFITSDKAYDNVEWVWGYRETDRLGGKDPYSASKAGAELAISSYFHSYLQFKPNIKIGIGRAGNVIGGGDWADSRIVPDAVRSWAKEVPVTLRNPKSTRPWQHVLEPLSGYIALAIALNESNNLNGEAFNFGPPSEMNFSVEKLIDEMTNHWKGSKWEKTTNNMEIKEANLLKLNCDKALFHIGWCSVWDFNQTVEETIKWYHTFYTNQTTIDLLDLTSRQIEAFIFKAQEKNQKWTK